MTPRQRVVGVGGRLRDEVWAFQVLARAGMVPVTSPRAVVALASATRRWGTYGAPPAVAAQRWPHSPALIDERGMLTYAELDERVNRLANAWRCRGVEAGDGVALLVRNHRGFMDAMFAAAKLGARIILLNTDFAGPQLRDVCAREQAHVLVYDEEFAELVAGVDAPKGRFRAWVEDETPDSLDALIASGRAEAPGKPAQECTLVVLTSGTTGTPKGAPRAKPKSLLPVAGAFGKVPIRSGGANVIAPPLFHALGCIQMLLSVSLGSTSILRRRFDPHGTISDVVAHRATMLVVVPTMLRRIVDLGEDVLDHIDHSSLRVVFVSGSQLGADLATRALDRFGPVVYNAYGSTEVAAATVATPGDLRAAPNCVGTPLRGIHLALLDDDGGCVTTHGSPGRIFVGSDLTFEGYTGGGNKEVIDGLMSTGDVGHLDAAGRLHIDGRDDDMIVSGGENLFPGEVEELLNAHPDIVEAAVIGVPDEQFGQRLRAFVVPWDRAALDDDAVRSYVRSGLARYKVPRDVVFLDELPRNPTGKILKRVLREQVVDASSGGSDS